MGLDLAEIMMDIEDEFCVQLTEIIKIELVGELKDYVIKHDPVNKMKILRESVPNNGEKGYMNFDEYKNCWRKCKSLPEPYGIFRIYKNKIRHEDVVKILDEKIIKYQNEIAIRQKIDEIIKHRGCVKFEITDNMHLVKDLNLG